MSGQRSDAAIKRQMINCAKLRKSGHTNREIARIQGIADVKRIPSMVKLGETLLTLEGDKNG